MPNTIRYRLMNPGEETALYELIVRVFSAHVAPHYSEDGVKKILGMLSPEWLRANASTEDSFVAVAEQDRQPVGMAAVINGGHIALLFVEPDQQGSGIGGRLIAFAEKRCKEINPSLEALTVSASPNSVAFYQKIGFQTQGKEIDEGGMRFRPMLRPLEFLEN